MAKASLEIIRFSQLGEGVAELEGKSVFVDGGIPGDMLTADVEPAGKVLRGKILAVERPSADRRAAACPLFERCGGCDWLHVSDAAQRRGKQEMVLSALEHLGGIARADFEVRPLLAAPSSNGYRRRAVLHFHKGQLALHERRSHASVPIDRCPALVPALETLPGALSPLLAPLKNDALEVHLLSEGNAAAFAVFLSGKVTSRHEEATDKAVRGLKLRGAVLVPKEGSPRILGKPVLPATYPLRPELTLYVRPDAFSQANAELNVGLVSAAVVELGASENDDVLELYSGNGNFTFAIAGTAKSVLAVESSAVSVELARRTLTEGAVDNVKLIQGDAVKVCEGLLKEGRTFDRLLLDPPRTGMPEIAKIARGFQPRRIVYVACDSSALARDAKSLRAQGYVPRTLQVIDMFPSTHHAEVVMAFDRS